MLVERNILGEICNTEARCIGLSDRIDTVDQYPSPVWLREAEQNRQGGRFAGAIAAEQRVDRACRHRQTKLVQHLMGAVGQIDAVNVDRDRHGLGQSDSPD